MDVFLGENMDINMDTLVFQVFDVLLRSGTFWPKPDLFLMFFFDFDGAEIWPAKSTLRGL